MKRISIVSRGVLIVGLVLICLTDLGCVGRPGKTASVSKVPDAPTSGEPKIDASADPQVTFHTSMGPISIQLFENQAKNTVANFVYLCEKGFFDGTRFHRVIKDFMMQGGDPLSRSSRAESEWGSGGPGYKFPDEKNGLKNARGYVSMANSGPDTNGSQFFVIFKDADHLNGKHTVFGRVTEKTMSTIREIESSAVPESGSKPLKPIVVRSTTVDRKRNHEYRPDVWMEE